MKKLLIALVMAVVFLTTAPAGAAPVSNDVMSTSTVRNCAYSSALVRTGDMFPQRARVFYRDCNNLKTRWFEVYKIRAVFVDASGGCASVPFKVYGGKVQFYLNYGGGYSYSPTLWTNCYSGKTTTVTKNIDSKMGRTWPSRNKFGVKFTQRNKILPDPSFTKFGYLK